MLKDVHHKCWLKSIKHNVAFLVITTSKYFIKCQETWLLIFENNVSINRIYVIKCSSAFVTSLWINRSYNLTVHILVWEKTLLLFVCLFVCHSWDFHKKRFWIFLIGFVVFSSVSFLPSKSRHKAECKAGIISCKWNKVSHCEIIDILVRERNLLSRHRNETLLLPSAACDAVLKE